MTDRRPLILGLLALVALLALGGAYVFEFSRGGQMRSAEADFMARMEAEGRTRPAFDSSPAPRTATRNEATLEEWYGATDPAVANPAGVAAEGTSTEPVDNSHLINDTRPFGAPMDDAADGDQAGEAEAATLP